MSIEDKIYSVITGAAIGDAMGLMTEFMSKDEVHKNYGTITTFKYDKFIKDGHRGVWIIHNDFGDWTDDTDQIIIIIKSLLDNGNLENVFAKKLFEWINKGLPECGDIRGCGTGISTSIWWGDKNNLTNPHLAAQRCFIYHPYSPCKSESNGGVMRTSILGLLPNFDDVIKKTILICASTHASPKCVASSLFISVLIHTIVNYGYSESTLSDVINKISNNIIDYVNTFNNSIHNIIKNIDDNDVYKNIIIESYNNYFIESKEDDILNELNDWIYVKSKSLSTMELNNNIGYTFKPVGCACYAIRRYLDNITYENTMIEILSEGGDADTNCCVAGAVFASLIKYNDLPEYEKNNLIHLHILNDYISKFINYFYPLGNL